MEWRAGAIWLVEWRGQVSWVVEWRGPGRMHADWVAGDREIDAAGLVGCGSGGGWRIIAMHWLGGVQVNSAMHVDRRGSWRGRYSAGNWGRKIWFSVTSEGKGSLIKSDVARDNNTTRWKMETPIAFVGI